MYNRYPPVVGRDFWVGIAFGTALVAIISFAILFVVHFL